MNPYIPFKKFERVVRRLRKLIRSKDATARRDALAYVVGLHGLRVTEVINLKVGDLHPIDEMLRVATLKGGKPRKVALGRGVFRELKRLTVKRPATAPLFVTTTGKPVHESHWQKGFRELTAELLGGEGLNFHGCRHTFAMRLYARTKDPQRVKARLGHRSAKSTQEYIDAYGELDDRELDELGQIEVLPNLVGEERGERKGRGRTGTGAPVAAESLGDARRGRRALSARPVSISTRAETGVFHGESADSGEMERTNSSPERIRRKKARSEDAGPTLLRVHNVRPLRQLGREVG